MSVDDNNYCYIPNKIINRECNHYGFMGFTHALSAVAVVLALLAFAPDIVDRALGVTSISLLVLFIFTLSGASLLPDLDNTRSTAGSALGLFGNVFSEVIRAISKVIQSVIRTKYDDTNPDPHRGAFHAPVIAVLLGFLTWLLVGIKGNVDLPLIGEVTWGYFSAMLLSLILIHIGFSGLFNKAMKSIKKSSVLGEVIALVVSLVVTVGLFMNIPENASLMWLPIALTTGMIIHDIGDAFTTAGSPLLAPIPIRGKLWYNVRIPPHIKAGGAAENMLFIPAFSIVIVASIVKIAIDLR